MSREGGVIYEQGLVWAERVELFSTGTGMSREGGVIYEQGLV